MAFPMSWYFSSLPLKTRSFAKHPVQGQLALSHVPLQGELYTSLNISRRNCICVPQFYLFIYFPLFFLLFSQSDFTPGIWHSRRSLDRPHQSKINFLWEMVVTVFPSSEHLISYFYFLFFWSTLVLILKRFQNVHLNVSALVPLSLFFSFAKESSFLRSDFFLFWQSANTCVTIQHVLMVNLHYN